MKLATRVAVILAIMTMIAGAATAATLDRAGQWTPKTTFPVTGPTGTRALITDGSFEQGPPPGSAWSEVTDQACEWIGNWSSVWGVAAFDGVYDYWAGGYCGGVPTTSSVTQSVAIPAGTAGLTFMYCSYRADVDDVPADGDQGYVLINGVEVWTLPFVNATNTYPNWAGPVMIDVSAYAGTTVSLTLGANSFGTATGNIRYDYVGLGEYIPPVTGACCAPSGTCALTTESACGGVWHGDWTCSPNNCPQPPPITNDTCAGAIAIPCGAFSISGTTTGATNDYSPTNGCTGYTETGPDIVYSVTLAAGDVISVTMSTGGLWDDAIYLLTDCANMNSCVAGSDLYPDMSTFTYSAVTPGIYYLIVDGYGGASGDFTIYGTVNCVPPVPVEKTSWGSIKASFR